jgi:hypothetical protein
MPALSIAPFIAIAPNVLVGTFFNEPPKLPIGVLAALTITTSLILVYPPYNTSFVLNNPPRKILPFNC